LLLHSCTVVDMRMHCCGAAAQHEQLATAELQLFSCRPDHQTPCWYSVHVCWEWSCVHLAANFHLACHSCKMCCKQQSWHTGPSLSLDICVLACSMHITGNASEPPKRLMLEVIHHPVWHVAIAGQHSYSWSGTAGSSLLPMSQVRTESGQVGKEPGKSISRSDAVMTAACVLFVHPWICPRHLQFCKECQILTSSCTLWAYFRVVALY
jgi:hypothetical protein